MEYWHMLVHDLDWVGLLESVYQLRGVEPKRDQLGSCLV